MRLAEIDVSGQEKIASAEVAVGATGFAGEIEARYLAGAGVGKLLVKDPAHARAALEVDPAARAEVASCSVVAEPPPFKLTGLDPAARDVAEGAYRALATLREILRR